MDSFLSRKINSIMTRFDLELLWNTGIDGSVYNGVLSAKLTSIPSSSVIVFAAISVTSPIIEPLGVYKIVPRFTISPLEESVIRFVIPSACISFA